MVDFHVSSIFYHLKKMIVSRKFTGHLAFFNSKSYAWVYSYNTHACLRRYPYLPGLGQSIWHSPHSILISKVERHGFDGCTTQLIKTWLYGCSVGNGSIFKWKPVMSGILQGSTLRLLLFNVFIDNMDSGIKCNLKYECCHWHMSSKETLTGWEVQQDQVQHPALVSGKF